MLKDILQFRRRVRRQLAFGSVIGLALLLGIPLAAQYRFPSADAGNAQQYPDTNGRFGQDANSPDQRRIRALNTERQKAIISDTEKLLKLARELNEEVAASDSGAMSGAQVHKVEEIGKLARSVKEKMSFSAGAYPPLTTLPGIQ